MISTKITLKCHRYQYSNLIDSNETKDVKNSDATQSFHHLINCNYFCSIPKVKFYNFPILWKIDIRHDLSWRLKWTTARCGRDRGKKGQGYAIRYNQFEVFLRIREISNPTIIQMVLPLPVYQFRIFSTCRSRKLYNGNKLRKKNK